MIKKSQSHIEFIVSFILFMGALIFIFAFINPVPDSLDISNIEGVQKSLINNVTEEIGRLSVILSEGGEGEESDDCYYFGEIKYGVNYREVKEGDRKYIVYFSDIFDGGYSTIRRSNCIEGDEGGYSLGAYTKLDLIVYEKFEELNASYDSDYNGLRESLGIRNDFVFSLKNVNGGVIIEPINVKQVPGGVERMAKEFSIRTINKEGVIKEYVLSIMSW